MKNLKICEKMIVVSVITMLFIGVLIAGTYDVGINSVPIYMYIAFVASALITLVLCKHYENLEDLIERDKRKRENNYAEKYNKAHI